MAIVLVDVAASTALALVVPTQTAGAGTAVADAGAGPIGGTKLGAPFGSSSPPVTGAAAVEGDGVSRSRRRRA